MLSLVIVLVIPFQISADEITGNLSFARNDAHGTPPSWNPNELVDGDINTCITTTDAKIIGTFKLSRDDVSRVVVHHFTKSACPELGGGMVVIADMGEDTHANVCRLDKTTNPPDCTGARTCSYECNTANACAAKSIKAVHLEISKGLQLCEIKFTDRNSHWFVESPMRNFRYFGFDLIPNSDVDEGRILSANYEKLDSQSELFVQLHMSVYCETTQSCSRWYLLLNDEHCKLEPIESVLSSMDVTTLHQSIGLRGICQGILKGLVEISLWVGRCKQGNLCDSKIWRQASLEVYEIHRGITTSNLTLPTKENVVHAATSDLHRNLESDYPNVTTVLQSITFNKQHDDTALQLDWTTTMDVNTFMRTTRRLRFNGSACANPADLYNTVYDGQNAFESIYHTTTMGGICRGLPAGGTLVEAVGARLDWNKQFVDLVAWTGYNYTTRWIITEIREGNDVDGYCLTGMPFFNVRYWRLNGANSGRGEKSLLVMSYDKRADMSALRIRCHGTMRGRRAQGGGFGYFYFLIDGNPCSPVQAKIRVGSQRTSRNPNVHTINTISAVCTNVPKGIIRIEFKMVGDDAGTEMYFNYNSDTNIRVEEVILSEPRG